MSKTFKFDFIENYIKYTISFEADVDNNTVEDFLNSFLETFIKFTKHNKCWEYLSVWKMFVLSYGREVKITNIKKDAKSIFVENENGWHQGKDVVIVKNGLKESYKNTNNYINALQKDIGDCDYYFSIQSIGFWDYISKSYGDSYWESYFIISRRIKTKDKNYTYKIMEQTFELDFYDKFYHTIFSFNEIQYNSNNMEIDKNYSIINDSFDNYDNKENKKIKLILPTEIYSEYQVEDFNFAFKILKDFDKIKDIDQIFEYNEGLNNIIMK